MRVSLAIAVLLLIVPPREAGASAADELCRNAGFSSGCIGGFKPSEREGSTPRAPDCDWECRRRAEEDRRHALEHMFHPPELTLFDPFANRFERAVAKRLKAREEQRLELASVAVVVVLAPVELPAWAPIVGGAVLGAAAYLA